ncbi:hypothetical protein C7374_12025 [Falsochrobactrum ovis]|uniref:Uncharacterized protein n=1 Tax=Falsochrobactrum ovis TaxID=1293442 RepID=A0A364JSD4_9HYPH|nr:hypothetical protein C7374_12025 [Falsochrobactrum ovis]
MAIADATTHNAAQIAHMYAVLPTNGGNVTAMMTHVTTAIACRRALKIFIRSTSGLASAAAGSWMVRSLTAIVIASALPHFVHRDCRG